MPTGTALLRIWQSLRSTDGFALLDFNEAILLRESGWQGPILLLEGFFSAHDLREVSHYCLTTAVHSRWQLAALAAMSVAEPLDIYLKVNSGMNRLGFHPAEVSEIWQQLRSMSQVGHITLMSHFASADSREGVKWQVDNFETSTGHLPGLDCWPTRRRRFGIQIRIMTGCAQASSCMALRQAVEWKTLRILA